jgi:hypothetical protein
MAEEVKKKENISASNLLESVDVIKDSEKKQNDDNTIKSCDIILKSLDFETKGMTLEEKKKIVSYLNSTSSTLNSFFLNGEKEKEKTQKRLSSLYNIPLSKSKIITSSATDSFGYNLICFYIKNIFKLDPLGIMSDEPITHSDLNEFKRKIESLVVFYYSFLLIFFLAGKK